MIKSMYTLENVCFATELRGDGDSWRIFGDCLERGMTPILISTPIAFDQEQNTITTQNSVYKVGSWNETSKFIKDYFWKELEDVIQHNGFKTV